MKKLGKLTINLEKVIKNEELVNLRGGNYHEWETGTCAAKNGMFCSTGLSKQSAIEFAGCTDTVNGTNCDGNWCCDNCGSASWLPCY